MQFGAAHRKDLLLQQDHVIGTQRAFRHVHDGEVDVVAGKIRFGILNDGV